MVTIMFDLVRFITEQAMLQACSRERAHFSWHCMTLACRYLLVF
jgi:hypothetical protein